MGAVIPSYSLQWVPLQPRVFLTGRQGQGSNRPTPPLAAPASGRTSRCLLAPQLRSLGQNVPGEPRIVFVVWVASGRGSEPLA